MKLYNLFESVILEEIEKHRQILSEGVSEDDVIKAIDGKYNVNILYRDNENSQPTKRYIQVYNLSVTKKGKEDGIGGNPAIRAYQIFGGSKTTPNEGAWKIFRLDRIEGWFPTDMKWKNPVSDTNHGIPDYNHTGDKTMASVTHKVDANKFSTERGHTYEKPSSDSTVKQKEKEIKTNLEKRKQQQPIPTEPVAQQPKQKDNTEREFKY